jgi:hypothetical protein
MTLIDWTGYLVSISRICRLSATKLPVSMATCEYGTTAKWRYEACAKSIDLVEVQRSGDFCHVTVWCTDLFGSAESPWRGGEV